MRPTMKQIFKQFVALENAIEAASSWDRRIPIHIKGCLESLRSFLEAAAAAEKIARNAAAKEAK